MAFGADLSTSDMTYNMVIRPNKKECCCVVMIYATFFLLNIFNFLMKKSKENAALSALCGKLEQATKQYRVNFLMKKSKEKAALSALGGKPEQSTKQ